MLDLAVILARLAQFASATVLFGTPLFFLYALPAAGPGAARSLCWPRPLLLVAAGTLGLAAAFAIGAQTAVMADSIADAFKWDSVSSVITDTQFGRGTILRLVLGVLSAAVLALGRPSRALWSATGVLGAGVVASFAWTGHGAIDDGLAGWIHLSADVVHLLAAAVWLGALASLSLLLLRSRAEIGTDCELAALHRALEGFSGIGSVTVAALLATGLANTWFLVGWPRRGALVGTAYGLLLAAKAGLFILMLALAAANRFRHSPRLGIALAGDGSRLHAVASLRRSVLLEMAAGAGVLALVAVLGTLAPPASG